tara:strand:- start:2895 stop:3899 length:1005 start_codon:yes stop_codon:yes gene_type:complete
MSTNRVFIIAEIGQAHDGSLGILHSYIDALSKFDIDAIKFQTHIAEAESSIHEPFRKNFSYVDNTRFDYWKRMEFTFEQWKEIKKHCEDVGKEFMSSPFSISAVDMLEDLGVKRYKIGSGEVNNFLLLEKIARTEKPIIISSGMSSEKEISETLNFLSNYNNDISLLQCTSSYPTKAGEIGLSLIREYIEKFKIPVGLSDHSGKIYPLISAVALGASIIEFHVVFDNKMFGPDSSSSIEINKLDTLIDSIRNIEIELDSFNKENLYDDKIKLIFEKSISVNKNLKKGHIISFDDLESKKPKGFGIDPKEFKRVIGMKLKNDKSKWDFLNWSDLD